ncbi:hypothetical protein [Bradyrhizobium sp. SZCCHNR3015]|uniref:hypothetical protein n=1 Tax=Bradyrhizobium sp. SZCCHNR3015 TaxID=3057395 RepID=UPI002916F220|nr:hypothetical protein [Bradyrhizobium sp. SZCCHNR3015]
MTKHNPTPRVGSTYGAPCGRSSDHLSGLVITDKDSRFTLQRIRLDSGGYDSGGAYWGHGQPLFWWSVTLSEEGCRDEDASGFMRASDRNAAKAKIRALHPAARFYR